jgi:hypothetical protein
MLSLIAAVIAGYLLWTAIWLGGNAAFFGAAAEAARAGTPVTEPTALIGLLVLSIVASMAGGLVTALIGRASAPRAARLLGGALLLTGIAVQASAWALMPVWYHLLFLGLLLPVTLLGASLVGRRSNAITLEE